MISSERSRKYVNDAQTTDYQCGIMRQRVKSRLLKTIGSNTMAMEEGNIGSSHKRN